MIYTQETLAALNGPELDAVVAEVVMGWTRGPWHFDKSDSWLLDGGYYQWAFEDWCPSVAWRCVGEVIGKLVGMGFGVETAYNGTTGVARIYCGASICAAAAPAPRALCIAAIMAVQAK